SLGPVGDLHPRVTSRFAFARRLLSASHGASRHAWRTQKKSRLAPARELTKRRGLFLYGIDPVGAFTGKREFDKKGFENPGHSIEMILVHCLVADREVIMSFTKL